MSNVSGIIKTMFELQDQFNAKLHPNWLNLEWNFNDAIWVECAELLEHIGYKWWKHQVTDRDQIIMELVDIWHFGMSSMMAIERIDIDECTNVTYTANSYVLGMVEDYNVDDFKTYIRVIVNDATDHEFPYFNVDAFIKSWYCMGLNIHDLYKMYIGKNALNVFRQNNGYKDGSYIKIWNGKEDNICLTEILSNLQSDTKLFDNVLQALQQQYQQLTA